MDHLSILAYGYIDQTPEAFFRLFGNRESELMQGERVVLVVEYSCWNGRTFNISIRVRIPGVNIPGHADPRRLENLVESRDRGGFGLGKHRDRGCEQGGKGRCKNNFFYF